MATIGNLIHSYKKRTCVEQETDIVRLVGEFWESANAAKKPVLTSDKVIMVESYQYEET